MARRLWFSAIKSLHDCTQLEDQRAYQDRPAPVDEDTPRHQLLLERHPVGIRAHRARGSTLDARTRG